MNGDQKTERGANRTIKRVRDLVKQLYAEAAQNPYKVERMMKTEIAGRISDALQGD
jgi:predicted GTPase